MILGRWRGRDVSVLLLGIVTVAGCGRLSRSTVIAVSGFLRLGRSIVALALLRGTRLAADLHACYADAIGREHNAVAAHTLVRVKLRISSVVLSPRGVLFQRHATGGGGGTVRISSGLRAVSAIALSCLLSVTLTGETLLSSVSRIVRLSSTTTATLAATSVRT